MSGVRVFSKLQRWSATDGKTLDLVGDDRISLQTRYNIKKNIRRSHHEINTPGAVGASFSHYRVWNDLLASSAPGCIVFEDDVYLNPEVIRTMRSTYAHVQGPMDMFLFGNAWIHSEKPAGGNYMKIDSFNGAHAYYIGREFAELLCAHFFPIEMHIEFYISKIAEFHGKTILRNRGLDVKYRSQIDGQQDSDTYFDANTCPLCDVPSKMDNGFYFTSAALREYAVSVGALGLVALGYLIASLKK
jgi:hypothetical protein